MAKLKISLISNYHLIKIKSPTGIKTVTVLKVSDLLCENHYEGLNMRVCTLNLNNENHSQETYKFSRCLGQLKADAIVFTQQAHFISMMFIWLGTCGFSDTRPEPCLKGFFLFCFFNNYTHQLSIQCEFSDVWQSLGSTSRLFPHSLH